MGNYREATEAEKIVNTMAGLIPQFAVCVYANISDNLVDQISYMRQCLDNLEKEYKLAEEQK